MKSIQTGNIFKIYDDSVRTYDCLPAGTYNVGYDQRQGCFLERRSNISVNEKSYGIQDEKLEKVFDSFKAFNRNLGVILSGAKGIGKSMFARKLCERGIKEGYAVIIIDDTYPGIARFIESIDQECIVLFDEFDKIFKVSRDNDDQAALLSLFDGTSFGKKLFVVTCNELYSLNSYIVNRPGRFHYHFRFDYPSAREIREYLEDNVSKEYWSEIAKVINFSRVTNLNYDCLRSIAFELNMGTSFSEAIKDLNVLTTENNEYKVYLTLRSGRVIHNLSYEANLLRKTDGLKAVYLYDNNGIYARKAWFDTAQMQYDTAKGEMVIPATGIKLDFNDSDDDYDHPSGKYNEDKPVKMVLVKKGIDLLHYVV